MTTPKLSKRAVLIAAEQMDWGQVLLNTAPPCFHICEDGRFCGRAERWAGHEDQHKFTALDSLIASMGGEKGRK